MLVVMIGIRKSLDCLFTHRELKILDDIMPEMTKRAAVEDMHNLEEGEVSRFCFKFFMSFSQLHFRIYEICCRNRSAYRLLNFYIRKNIK